MKTGCKLTASGNVFGIAHVILCVTPQVDGFDIHIGPHEWLCTKLTH